MSKRPNILFIMADQMKASILRIYSEIGIECPQIEKLAEEGIKFDNAITPSPLCVPARTSIMTGKYPHNTGCRRNETLLPEGEFHAFKVWKKAGYTTGLIGKNHCYVNQSDLDLFDVRLEISHQGLPKGDYVGANVGNTGMDWIKDENIINEANKNRLEMSKTKKKICYSSSNNDESTFSTSLIANQSIKFLEKFAQGSFSRENDPFALWVSFPDPHEPYEAPKRYVEMFPKENVKLPPQRKGEFDDESSPERNKILYEIMGHKDEPEDEIRAQISIYQAMCKFIDDEIKKIIDKLEELNLKDDTIIVFTSDHGDFMGEHGMFVKGGVFYDCLVKVPLIISWNKGKFPVGEVEEKVVSTIDIIPTIFYLQGLGNFSEIGKAWKSEKEDEKNFLSDKDMRSMHGSLLPKITKNPSKNIAFSEYGAGGPRFRLKDLEKFKKPFGYKTLLETLWAREAEGRRKMVRTDKWKYITDNSGDIDELYDLTNDPWELRNLANKSKYSSVINEMKNLLLNWMIETEDKTPVELPNKVGREFDFS